MSEITVHPGRPLNDGGSEYDMLYTCVESSKRAYSVLEELLEHPVSGGRELVRPSSFARAWPSWNTQAAYLIFDLRQLTRDHENRLLAFGAGTVRGRGSSDRNTFLSLDALPKLAHAAGTDEVRETLTVLSRWLRRAREALGEVEPLGRLPRLPGAPEPRCPWCERMTLRQQPHAGLVRCVNPSCRDTDGNRPLARVEIGRLSLEPMLVWGTGEVGL
jgi:hypothetical protein